MMKGEMKAVIGGTLFILAFAIASSLMMEPGLDKTEVAEGSWACTTEVQICPDGSSVHRTPPYCKFAACPN